MAQGYDRRQIAHRLGLKQRTADRYRQLVIARWHEEHELNRPHQVQLMLGKIARDCRRMEADEAWGALAATRRLEADIRGLRAPERLDIRAAVLTADVGPKPLDLSGLSDAQLDALRVAYGALNSENANPSVPARDGSSIAVRQLDAHARAHVDEE